MAALEMLRSASFVYVAGAYFEAKSVETEALLAILDAELSARTLPALLNRALQVSAHTFGASTGALLLKDSEGNQLGLQAAIGMDVEEFGVTIPIGEGFSGRIAQNGTPEVVLDTRYDERVISSTLRGRANTPW